MGATARKPSIPGGRATPEGDRFTWAREQAALLRAGKTREIDAVNIASEIDDVGAAEYHRMESALRLVLLHLLKWDFQPAKRSVSWVISIQTHRRHFNRQMRKNPGLKSELGEALVEAYADAVGEAIQETGLARRIFPSVCPYDWDTILNREIAWPEED